MKRINITQSITNVNQNSLKRYLNDISNYDLLSLEEEISLGKKIKTGDKASLQQLIKCNLRFVISVAKKYEGQGILLTDLISTGNIGLIKAAERFDETRGIKFISFAVWWIRRSIMQTIAEEGRMIHLPVSQSTGISAVKKAQKVLEQKLERVPSAIEIAVYTGFSIEKVKDHQSISYQNAQLSTEDQEDKIFTPPDTEIQHEYLRKAIANLFQSLSDASVIRWTNITVLMEAPPLYLKESQFI